MATGQKISAQTVATSYDSGDLMTIVQSGVNKSVDHDVLMDDTQVCKAWVNFDGTGVVAIRDDFNVSSITDLGTGNYQANYTNVMSDINYVIATCGSSVSTDGRHIFENAAKTVNNCTVITTNDPAAATDSTDVMIIIFGS